MSAPALADPGLDHARRRVRSTPARATRVGAPPRPRVRPLGDVLAELVRPALPSCAAPEVVPPAPSAPPPALDDPGTHAVVVRLLQAVVEVLDGVRPAAHLRRVCDDGVHVAAVLTHLAAPGARRARSRLRGVRVCVTGPDVVEAAGVVHRGDRARALAARLEHDGHTWRFTALTML